MKFRKWHQWILIVQSSPSILAHKYIRSMLSTCTKELAVTLCLQLVHNNWFIKIRNSDWLSWLHARLDQLEYVDLNEVTIKNRLEFYCSMEAVSGDECALSLQDIIQTPTTNDPAEVLQKIQSQWSAMTNSERILLSKIITGKWIAPFQLKDLAEGLREFFNCPPLFLQHALLNSKDAITFYNTLEKWSSERTLTHIIANDLYQDPPIIDGSIPMNQPITIEPEWYGKRIIVMKGEQNNLIIDNENKIISQYLPEWIDWANKLEKNTIVKGVFLAISDKGIDVKSSVSNRFQKKKLTSSFIKKHPLTLCVTEIILLPKSKQDSIISSINISDYSKWIAAWGHQYPIIATQTIDLDQYQQPDFWSSMHFWHVRSLLIKSSEIPPQWIRVQAPRQFIKAVLLYVDFGRFDQSTFLPKLSLGLRRGEDYIVAIHCQEELPDEVTEEIKTYIKLNKIERFGSVVSVKPGLVIEVSYERVERNKRRKIGLEVIGVSFVHLHREAHLSEVDRLNLLLEVVSD